MFLQCSINEQTRIAIIVACILLGDSSDSSAGERNSENIANDMNNLKYMCICVHEHTQKCKGKAMFMSDYPD